MSDKDEIRELLARYCFALDAENFEAMASLFTADGVWETAFGTGTGSELRKPLGITIVGGLIVSQMLTLYTTPVVYLYLDRFRLRVQGLRRRWGMRTPVPQPAGD